MKKRELLFKNETNIKIKENLCSSEIYKNARNIMCYYSVGNEIPTIEYFEDKNKNWFLPKIDGENLLICPLTDELIENKYKIKEPNTNPISADLIDMIIIPALCADKNGYRIGYGKGYYDRFLKKIPSSVVKVVLVYSELLVNSVHPDYFDEKCDYIITENEIYKI